MKNLRFKTKLMVLSGTAVTGLLVFAALIFPTISEVAVGGPIYLRIVTLMDLNSDYVPAGQSLAVPVVHAVKMEEAPDATTSQHFQEALRQDKRTFDDEHAAWMRRLPEGKLKDLVGGRAYSLASDWYRVMEQEFVPALLSGDRKKAHEIRTSKMAPLFAAQEATVNDIVQASAESIAYEQGRANALVQNRKRMLMGVAMAVIAVMMLISYFIVRGIVGSLTHTLVMLRALAEGDLCQSVTVNSSDELGEMGQALNQAQSSLHDLIQSIRKTAQQVAMAGDQLSESSMQIMTNSEDTSAKAMVVSEAGGQINTNLQTLASGAEQMNSSIGEIAKNATKAARVAGEAVGAAESANQTVSLLGDSSNEIGKVIEVIHSIAQQTNLLALNATIEAARAGEAGKGFAVVANEVKELAKQTAKATEEIKQKITVIRDNTGGAVAAIGGIKTVIDQINIISTEIATAVEEQSATTSEMARNVTEAARGAGTIASNIQAVADGAQNTSTCVGDAQIASEQLSRRALQLREQIDRFKVREETGEKTEGWQTKSAAAGR
jgi:methyl-accepting chemotaxis protein